jgi:TonB family protein
MDVVTQVVSMRAQQVDGLQRMIAASIAAHVGLIAVVMLAPAAWFGARTVQEDENVMVISLGGAPGPRDGGLTTLGGRPVQAVADAKPAIEPVRPPAARAPEMIEPTKTAPKKAETKVRDTAPDPKSRTPTKGKEVEKGSSVADTGGRGQGFGLSSGGGGTGSYLDTANFCCPEYVATMIELIRRNWDEKQQVAGTTLMKFTIQRDGTLTGVQVEQSSGYSALDLYANRALIITKKLPPLPAAFTEPTLTVHLTFEYLRR